MYAGPLHLLGIDLSIWNATFLAAIVLGYPVLWLACRSAGPPVPRFLVFRYAGTVYGTALGAQLFAYVVDRHTSVLPPPGISWVRYYFDPLSGPKTLYGAVLVLPVAALTLWEPRRGRDYVRTLDGWAPPLFAVLAIARVGCLLEGCCYGVPARWGLAFPAGTPASHRHVAAGWIAPGAASLPVVPTQAIEALLLAGLSVAALRALAAGRRGIFLPALAAYGICRFVLEFLRDDPERNVVGPFSVSQWVALALLGGYGAWRHLPAR